MHVIERRSEKMKGLQEKGEMKRNANKKGDTGEKSWEHWCVGGTCVIGVKVSERAIEDEA